MSPRPVLIAGEWRAAQAAATFQAENPATGTALPGEYPVSAWADADAALAAAADAAAQLRATPPGKIARFLTRFAERLEARAAEIVDLANLETALPKMPRLSTVELPRTATQLRQAAAAAADGGWAQPTIDTRLNIRSYYAPLGPVWVFGPNNFPLAFNSAAGGDFAAAIAAGNPVIAKANSSHPGTTRLLAEEARAAVGEAGLPAATVQLLYRLGHGDGLRLAADPRTGALAYTGSRAAGLALKAAADAAGKPIYLELSSINPVLILPGALAGHVGKMADEFSASCLLGAGQFCTNPGLVILLASAEAEKFIAAVKEKFAAATPAPLLSGGVARALAESVRTLTAAGAHVVAGGAAAPGPGHRFANTLLRVDGKTFLAAPAPLQTEAFGNAALVVVAGDAAEARRILEHLEGSLTGGIYSHAEGADDALYAELAPLLRGRVGRLLNDKMPTGVAVSPAMHHGGPYPATGHPGFTAVGIPAALRRFAMLQCFDNVRPARLPEILRNHNTPARPWRLLNGSWTQADFTG